MNYGHFDSKAREYVITRPDTPAPWANYLGSPEYGAIISGNAGGYSFIKSGAAGRLLRYRFNESDKPGRYFYLRDDDTKDYWSASWQPCGIDLSEYKSKCRHGTGYTIIESDYKGIATSAAYYVPQDAKYEICLLEIKNSGELARNISIFGYAEFTNDPHYEQDGVNLQFSQFISKTYYNDNIITQTIAENVYTPPDELDRICRFYAVSGANAATYCGDREKFIGIYGDYSKPNAVLAGKCDNSLNFAGNSCGALHTRLKLEPNETKTLVFITGENTRREIAKIYARYNKNPQLPQQELGAIKKHWHAKLDNLQVETPDPDFNEMLNTWNAYQCFITFIWSRAASLIYCGLRNGYGYRDTVQDIQGIIHLSPDEAREKIIFMLTAQVEHGGALPLVKYTHTPGKENKPEDPEYGKETGHPSYRADDALWLFPTVYKYIAETGELDFLNLEVPFADNGSATVYEHLKRAIEFSERNSGVYGLPAGLHADWNDCLRLGKEGASVFVAQQLYYAYEIIIRFARKIGDNDTETAMSAKQKSLGDIIDTKCWDGDRYIRGINEKYEIVGGRDSPECDIWLNPQSWAVISQIADGERGRQILDLAYKRLNTPYGAVLMNPSFNKHPIEGGLAVVYHPGLKENGGIFLQTQGWLILAEALLGRGSRAYEYYRESCPAAQNDIAEIRRMEPYAYSQFTEGGESPNAGRSWVHWLTGTASTVMVGCVEGILGIRPNLDGLKIEPSIPPEWKTLTMKKVWRGKTLNITVNNPNGKENGLSRLTINGCKFEKDNIAFEDLAAENDVIIEM